MNNVPLSKAETGVARNNYSDEEITLIYELARLSFETGNHRRAELLARGLTVIAPDFIPSYLLLAIVLAFAKAYDQASDLVASALRLNENSLEAQLLGASIYLAQGNYTMAGTLLGEAGERIKSDSDIFPALKNFYNIQLARFDSR